MARLSKETWLQVEVDYRAGLGTNQELAEKYGIHPNAIGLRAKKYGWVRQPGEAKRQLVEAKMALHKQTVDETVAETVEREATADAAVLSKAAAMFDAAIDAAKEIIDMKPGAQTLNWAVTAGKAATAAFKDVRGLDKIAPEKSDFESVVRRLDEAGELG